MLSARQPLHEEGEPANANANASGGAGVLWRPLVTCSLPPVSQHSQQLYRHIFLACKEESSTQPHFEALYALLALISVELANEEVVVDLIRLALALQVPPPPPVLV